MAIPRHVFASAFRHRRMGWFFVLLVAITVYFASFATAAEAVLSMTTMTWDKDMQSRLTVEIPAVDDESSVSQPDRVAQALSALRAMPGVEWVTQVPEEETARLLKPWIRQPELIKQLPVPVLIDVERKDSKLRAADLQEQLRAVVSDVHVEDHAEWLSAMANLAQGLTAMGALIIALAAATLIITVSLLCHTIMATEHESIALLHVMGAEDREIARHFQYHARRMAFPASLAGFILALATVGPLLFFFRRFADLSAMRPMHWAGLGAAIVLVPIAAIVIATVSARLSALRSLRGMP